jgi:hypothetical protein
MMEQRDYDSLVEAMNDLHKRGFGESFHAVEDGIRATQAKKVFPPEKMKVYGIYRFEGMTNPSDQSELFALETDNGIKGTLVHNYGADSNQNEEMIKKLPS